MPRFLIGFLALMLGAPSAPSFVRNTNAAGEELFRPDAANLQFFIHEDISAGALNTDGRKMITSDSDPLAALIAAMETWASTPGNLVEFAPIAQTSVEAQEDGRHVFLFTDTPEVRSLLQDAFATTIICSRTGGPMGGAITDTDILFNPAFGSASQFFPFSTTRMSGTIDLQSVATHEIGHALGANRSGVIASAMFPDPEIGFDYRDRLSDDDIAFLVDAYPSSDAADRFGSIEGTLTTTGGDPATGAFVAAVSPEMGVTVSVLTDLRDGTYRIPGLPRGFYLVYAEPLDGPILPTDLQQLDLFRFNTEIRSRFFGGNERPNVVQVLPGREVTANITVSEGVSALEISFLGLSPPGAEGDITHMSAGPVHLEPGDTVDLLLAGVGIDSSLTADAIQLLLPDVTIRQGAVFLDSKATFRGFPVLRMTVDAAPLQERRQAGTIVVSKGPAVGVFSGAVAVEASPEGPKFPAQGIVNAASFTPGPIAPGEIVSLFGNDLGPEEPVASLGFDPLTGRLPTFLGEVAVTVGGIAAPLIFVSATQINLVVPNEVAGSSVANAVVTFEGTPSAEVPLPVAPAAPAIFAQDASGTGPGAILNAANGRLNSIGNPVRRGDFIVIFATGQGLVSHPPLTGQPAPSEPLSEVLGEVSVMIGDEPAPNIFFAGLTPGFVGLAQVNVQVPGSVAPGREVPVKLTIEGADSQPGITLAVQ